MVKNSLNSRFTHPTSTGTNHIPSLDGIRGLAIIMVVYCHFFATAAYNGTLFPVHVFGHDIQEFLYSGSDGVRLFFILSGFLLSLPFFRAYHGQGKKVNVAKYFKRRVLRIIPAYYFVIAVYIFLAFYFGNKFSQPFCIKNIFASTFFLQPFFPRNNGVSVDFVPGTWSLVPEVAFYLTLPFIFRFFTTFKRALLSTLIAVVLCHYFRDLGPYTWIHNGNQDWVTYGVFIHADQFALGMLAGLIYHKQTSSGTAWFRDWMNYLMVLLGITLYFLRFNKIPFPVQDKELVVEIGALLLILGVVLGNSIFKKIFELSVFRFIGLISYSMFLINLTLARYLLAPTMNALRIMDPVHRLEFNMTFGVAALVLISAVSYLYIERPFLIGKQKEKSLFHPASVSPSP